MKKTICVLCLIGSCLSAYSSGNEPIGGGDARVSIQIKYKRGVAALDTLYLDNRASLDSLVSVLGNLPPGVTVSVKGSASPDGTAPSNRRLAYRRAEILRAYILGKTSLPASAVRVEDSDIDWISLGEMVSATDRPWRDEAVRIISDTPVFIYDSDHRIVDGRKRRLGMLYGGEAWRYMEERFFGDLRYADVSIGCGVEASADTSVPADTVRMPEPPSGKDVAAQDRPEEKPAGTVPADDIPDACPDSVSFSGADADVALAVPPYRKFNFAVRTNMLSDLAAMPNIGLEFRIGEHWSAAAGWTYAWWSSDARHRYWRVYGGDIELRRWFPSRASGGASMCGHHVGLYGQMLTYDFEWGGKGRLSDSWNWGAGLSYGYSLPIAERLNIDFTVGAGFLQGGYMVYHPEGGCYVWESTHKMRWFGPAKAEISLVWFIGGRDGRKGGGR